MERSKEELILIDQIERFRERLDKSIDSKEDYETIYRYSVELDHLIEQYILAGF